MVRCANKRTVYSIKLQSASTGEEEEEEEEEVVV
jgi:hypothetical protein